MSWLESILPFLSIPVLSAFGFALYRCGRWVHRQLIPALDAKVALDRCVAREESRKKDYDRLDQDYKVLEVQLEKARYHMGALEGSIAEYEGRLAAVLQARLEGHPTLSSPTSTLTPPPLVSKPPPPPPTISFPAPSPPDKDSQT